MTPANASERSDFLRARLPSQARLFNEPDNAYRVLVASDAVGMGLNLNIRRVIFHSMLKYDGAQGPPSVAGYQGSHLRIAVHESRA